VGIAWKQPAPGTVRLRTAGWRAGGPFIPDILPLSFTVTPAGASELKRLTPVMGSLREHNPELLQNSKKYAFPSRSALLPENPSEMHREKPVNQGNLHYNANGSNRKKVSIYSEIWYFFLRNVVLGELLSEDRDA